jgi:hypothetical protein
MRDKLNENPVAQIALIGVLVLVAAWFLLLKPSGEKSGSGGGESASSSESIEQVSATSAIAAPAGRRLPHKVDAAYKHGDTIALLVYRRGGIDDKVMRIESRVITAMPGVAFFATPTDKVARYSAITGPVGVNRAPALVVVRARKHNHGAAAPATVTYGAQGPEQIRQAVIDAGYTGKQGSYAPN